MADQDFVTAFNNCVDRLAAGHSVDDCLRQYPQHAPALRPLLEAGLAVRRARVSPVELSQAQARVRERVARAARAVPAGRPVSPLRSLASLAAALLIVFFAAGGGAILAQGSLPGDLLYGVKRLTETVRLSLNDSPALRDELAARRVEEIRQMLALSRPADVNFTGEVNAITADVWVVAGLPVSVPASTPRASDIRVGDRVEVRGYTTARGELLAREITLIEPGEREPAPTSTPVPTRAEPTITPSAPNTATTTPAPPSATPTATDTPTPTATETPQITPTSVGCTPAPPSNWTIHTVQLGDTLSALAAARGISLAEILRVNCISNASLIVAGQRLYLPPGSAPTQPAAPTAGSDSPPVVNPPEDNSNHNDNGDDSGKDNSNGNRNDND